MGIYLESLENPKKEKPILAQNIIRFRHERGWTAEVLAEKAGIPYPTLRDIEAGISGGRPSTKEAIAKALNCTISDLYAQRDPEARALEVYKTVEPNSPDPKIDQNLEKFAEMMVDLAFERGFRTLGLELAEAKKEIELLKLENERLKTIVTLGKAKKLSAKLHGKSPSSRTKRK